MTSYLEVAFTSKLKTSQNLTIKSTEGVILLFSIADTVVGLMFSFSANLRCESFLFSLVARNKILK